LIEVDTPFRLEFVQLGDAVNGDRGEHRTGCHVSGEASGTAPASLDSGGNGLGILFRGLFRGGHSLVFGCARWGVSLIEHGEYSSKSWKVK